MKDWSCGHVVAGAADERLDTQTIASCAHPRCRESATCVHGLEHYERPGDTRRSSSAPGYGPRSRGVRDILADRITEEKKSFSRVTTRRRNLGPWSRLRREPRPLPICALSLGMPGSRGSVPPMLGLPPGCLPAMNLPQTFGILTVTLVPTPRLVLAATTFAQAGSRARSARSGQTAAFSLNVAGAHGRYSLPREKLGENAVTFSPSAIKTRIRRSIASLPSL